MALFTETGQLNPVPPFDFAQSLSFVGAFMPMRNEQALTDHTLIKAVSIAGQAVAFQISSGGTTASPILTYILYSEQPLSESVRMAAVDRASFFLSLTDDLEPFYAIGRDDPPFAPILTRLYGYHQVKFLTPFENACWAVLTQRNLMAVAQKMKQALIERFGTRIVINDVTYWAFPEASHLAAADPYDLSELIGHGPKGEGLSILAKAFSHMDEQFLRTAPYEEAEAWLRSIKGIGAWSASFVLLRGLGRTERMPVNEKRVLDAINRVYGPTHDVSSEGIQRLAARYGNYQGYWAHYLRAGS